MKKQKGKVLSTINYKKNVVFIFILLLLFIPSNCHANIKCNDGTISPSCYDCHQGCCSHHEGCLQRNSYNDNEDDINKENNEIYYIIGGAGAVSLVNLLNNKNDQK